MNEKEERQVDGWVEALEAVLNYLPTREMQMAVLERLLEIEKKRPQFEVINFSGPLRSRDARPSRSPP
jgi:hypothetical protein